MDEETIRFEPLPTTFLRRWWWALLLPAFGLLISGICVLLVIPRPPPTPDPFAVCAQRGALEGVPLCRNRLQDKIRTEAPLTLGLWGEPPIAVAQPLRDREGLSEALVKQGEDAQRRNSWQRVLHARAWERAYPWIGLAMLPWALSMLVFLPLGLAGRARRRGTHAVTVSAAGLVVDHARFPWSELTSVRLLPERDYAVRELVIERENGRRHHYALHLNGDEDTHLQALLDRACPTPAERLAERQEANLIQREVQSMSERAREPG